MRARSFSGEQYNGLKSALRRLCGLHGGQDAASFCTRVSQQHISRCVNPSHDAEFATIDVVMDLEKGMEPLVTRELARMGGYFLLRRPECAGGSAALMQASGAAMQECSEAFAAIGDALSDGKISAEEARNITKEANEAMEMMAALIEVVKAEVEDGE